MVQLGEQFGSGPFALFPHCQGLANGVLCVLKTARDDAFANEGFLVGSEVYVHGGKVSTIPAEIW